MHKFTLENKPKHIPFYQKKTKVQLLLVHKPFAVETQEGDMIISPETTDDWGNGYYVAYPDDGSKPYSISPSFVCENYERVE